VGHGLLGAVMLALGMLMSVAVILALGIQLPSPRQVLASLDLGHVIGQRAPAPSAGLKPTAAGTPAPQAAPHCAPGQVPSFEGPFAELKRQLGETMGQPLECAHVHPDQGDTLQVTTAGLAVHEKATGLVRFTDGWRHWATAGAGVESWEGQGDPPPEAAAALGLAAQPTSAPRPTAPPSPTAPPASPQRVRVANTDARGVALRNSPTMTDRRPYGFTEGTLLTVLERRDDHWLRVRGPNGVEGWVPARYTTPAG
jgi:hypothetical protein